MAGLQPRHRPGMERAGVILEAELSKLAPVQARLAGVERKIQEQIVVDIFRGDKNRAKMLAAELVMIRRVYRLVSDLRIIYETLIVRIATINNYQELLSAIRPAAADLRDVQSNLAAVMPAARETFSGLSEVFSGTLSTLNIVNDPLAPGKATDDALEILDEASRLVEEELKRRFPTLPEIKTREAIPA